jgi:zinc transporter
MPADEYGLVCAFVLDGQGGGRPLDWEDIAGWQPGDGTLWLHFDRTFAPARDWLRNASDIPPTFADALLARGTRPRALTLDNALLLILRGVNLNPGEDPVDMVSLRMFIDRERIVSVRRQKLYAIDDVRQAIVEGRGPVDPSDFVIKLADALTARMDPMLHELNDELDRLEAELRESEDDSARPRLIKMQRETIELRRYLEPQRDALRYLRTAELDWLGDSVRFSLHYAVDQVTRYLEDLDAGQERALVLHEQITDRLSEKMNRNMYVLSVLAAIFLPLDFLTGLLGVNLGGIPGETHPWGFPALIVGLAAFGGALYLLFRKMKWL